MAHSAAKTAFVLPGRGSLGAVQVGMLRMLVAFGVQPDFVVGASAGALNASYFAGTPNAAGVTALEQIWQKSSSPGTTGSHRADLVYQWT